MPLPSHVVGQAGNEGPAPPCPSSQVSPHSSDQAGSLGWVPKPGEDACAQSGLCVCLLLDKLTMGNHWHNHPMQVEMEPQSRTWSCSPSPAFSVPRRPNPSWSLSESCWMLQHLQDAGFCSWLSEAGTFLQFLHRLLRETCLQKGDLGPYPYSGLLLS